MSAQPVEQPCTRRWFSTWTQCRCPNCATHTFRVRKANQTGLLPATPSDQAWTNTAISTACGFGEHTAYRLTRDHRLGNRRTIGRGIATRLLTHGQPTAGHVGSLATTRRLQALQAIGWSGDHIHTHVAHHMSRMTITNLLNADWPRVRPAAANAIADLYERLQHTPGPSSRARARAAARGWAPPAAWDNIDDPNEHPKGVGLRAVTKPPTPRPPRAYRPARRPECGTRPGYERHKRNKETRCDPCLDWVRRNDAA